MSPLTSQLIRKGKFKSWEEEYVTNDWVKVSRGDEQICNLITSLDQKTKS